MTQIIKSTRNGGIPIKFLFVYDNRIGILCRLALADGFGKTKIRTVGVRFML